MPIKILVVDDSVVSRKFLSDLLAGQADLEVVGSAVNGKMALAKVGMLDPDLVLLDVEMPVMDGIATLKELKRTAPDIHVIMFSSHTRAGAAVTVEALTLGAADYVPKPADLFDADSARREVAGQLLPKINALFGRGVTATAPPPAPPPPLPETRFTPGRKTVDLVAIGSSTGGPNALAAIFAQLPGDLPVPIVVVQHMPATFTPMLAERLTRQSALEVSEAAEGTRLAPGQAWIAPGGKHLVLGRRLGAVSAHLNMDPPENSCRPAVDVLFRSVAATYRHQALAVVLTGMGEDGMRGAQELHRHGAPVIAQDQESSVVWGMAGSVVKAGVADAVLPLSAIAAEIVRRVRTGR